MTVCIAVKVNDCIVFAADSASTQIATTPEGQSYIEKIWQHENKVFNLYKGLPIVAMTAGMGNFGSSSVSNLAKEFRFSLSSGESDNLDKENYTIQEVAERASKFFYSKYSQIVPPPSVPHSFDFWVGGYGVNTPHGEIWQLAIRDGVLDSPKLVAGVQWSGVIWGGQSSVMERLLFGFDLKIQQIINECGLNDEDRHRLIDTMKEKLEVKLAHSIMPVQDAINLADFLVDVTKRTFAFYPGANIVAGDTDIATVTKYEGFKWINRKHYYSKHINSSE